VFLVISLERGSNEERRLFYVALTRAVEHLFILTEASNLSPFLEELSSRKKIPSLNWSDYPPLVGATQRITVKVGNQDGRGANGTYTIRDLLKAEGHTGEQMDGVLGAAPIQHRVSQYKQFFDRTCGVPPLMALRCGFMMISRRC
jgi:DNA helicase-4